MKRIGERGLRGIMLAAGFVLLLTVVVPHHHHEGGEICISLSGTAHDCDGDAGEHTADCESAGHTVVFHAPETLSPGIHPSTTFLYILFDYLSTSQLSALSTGYSLLRAVVIASPTQEQASGATGRRAPPTVR